MNNIKKPRLKKNLDKGYLNEIKGSDIICDLSFIDEKSLNDIKDIEFNGCLFKNIDFSDCRLKNVDFINCSFEACNLPNMDICEKLISRCEFINSSLVGFFVKESNLKDVSFYNSNISYMNMSSKLKNVSFTNSNMTGARLFENEFSTMSIRARKTRCASFFAGKPLSHLWSHYHQRAVNLIKRGSCWFTS